MYYLLLKMYFDTHLLSPARLKTTDINYILFFIKCMKRMNYNIAVLKMDVGGDLAKSTEWEVSFIDLIVFFSKIQLPFHFVFNFMRCRFQRFRDSFLEFQCSSIDDDIIIFERICYRLVSCRP